MKSDISFYQGLQIVNLPFQIVCSFDSLIIHIISFYKFKSINIHIGVVIPNFFSIEFLE